MILLDTNVLSAMMRLDQEPAVQAWLDRQELGELYTTAPTVFEIQFGAESLPQGRRRRELEAIVAEILNSVIEDRVIDFDTQAAEAAAKARASQIKRGINADITDSQIAGIALHHNVPLATRNMRHFSGLAIPLINPWE